MNIDLLFFESSFEKKDDYIKDQEIFQEYINTHSFEGNSNELLFMPPSMSSNNNKTLLIGCEDISQNNKELLELGYSILPKSIESKRMKENFNLDFSISQIDMDYIKTLDRGGSITWEYGDPLKIV